MHGHVPNQVPVSTPIPAQLEKENPFYPVEKEKSHETTTTKRILIIGGGPAGLSMLKQCHKLNLNAVCFEKQLACGGLWNFDRRQGISSSGSHVHGSMYMHLYSNGPRECIEYPDYSFSEHFNEKFGSVDNIPSYPPREMIADYLLGRP